MKKELKIRIHDYKRVEKNLLKRGARFSRKVEVRDTYFNQEPGKVLKITESSEGDFLFALESENGGFRITRKEAVKDVEKTKTALAKEFGLKCVLEKRMRFFEFGDYAININLIDDVGEFLILEGENPTKEFIEEKLGIKNPEYITVSFDELKLRQQKRKR